MGWVSIVKFGKGASKIRVPKLRFSGLSSLGTRFSTWIQGTKFTSWLKAGLAGGVGYTIYHGWTSGVDSIAKATGLDSSTVESLLFAGLGIMVAYVAAKLLFPDSGTTTVVVGDAKVSRTHQGSSKKKSSVGSKVSKKSKGARR